MEDPSAMHPNTGNAAELLSHVADCAPIVRSGTLCAHAEGDLGADVDDAAFAELVVDGEEAPVIVGFSFARGGFWRVPRSEDVFESLMALLSAAEGSTERFCSALAEKLAALQSAEHEEV
jgi:hypothetical protein